VAWAAEQTRNTMRRLTANPDFPKVETEINRAKASSAPTPAFYLIGDRVARFQRDDGHKAGALYVASRSALASGSPVDWQMVLDVDTLNKQEGKKYEVPFLNLNIQCLPPNFNRCLIPLSDAGASLAEYREFDFTTGQFVKDGFRSPPTRGDFAWLDADTILIGYVGKAEDRLASSFARNVVAWKRGTAIADAKIVYAAEPADSMVSATTFGTGTSQRGLLTRVVDYSNFELYLMAGDGRAERVDLPTQLQNFGTAFVTGSRLVVQLAAPATIEGKPYTADTLISYDLIAPAGHRVTKVFAPAEGSYVNDAFDGIAAIDGGIAFVETRNLRKTLMLAKPTAQGWSVTRVMSASPGVAMTIASHDTFGSSLVVREAGFLEPTRLSLVTPGSKPVALFAGKAVIDATKFVAEIRSARSADGTLVDYYLVRSRQPQSGPVPVILSGYGGYGYNSDPNYFSYELGLGYVPWLSRGGAFAVAAIRGGGERGSAWASAARGIHRQRTFDDFAAVAKDMVTTGFTAPGRIGSMGRSFGGFLSANMVVQQPKLFGAAIVGVPITDLFRSVEDRSVIGAGMTTETGDPADPKQVPIILGYSPYQNVRAGVTYPKVLTVVSTEDGQVGPGYGRRFAAKLQSVGADSMLLEGPTGGHGFPSMLANPKEFAAQVTFFIDSLMPDRAVR
jgi:prolyl oligopeptidase